MKESNISAAKNVGHTVQFCTRVMLNCKPSFCLKRYVWSGVKESNISAVKNVGHTVQYCTRVLLNLNPFISIQTIRLAVLSLLPLSYCKTACVSSGLYCTAVFNLQVLIL
jgi:hypothetical protein